MCQFVLAKVVFRASSHVCACVGCAQVFRKIHCKKIRRVQGPTRGAIFLVSRTNCSILRDFVVVELILSVCGGEIWIQCTKLYRLMHVMFNFVVFPEFAIF